MTQEQIELLKRTICKEATDDELQLFLGVCQRTQLDPFARQIYANHRYDKKKGCKVMTIMVSIDGFRLIAERTQKYAGQDGPYWCGADGKWTDVWLDSKHAPAAARVGVFRNGFQQPLYAVATWEAYSQEGFMWSKMGAHMLAKCAEMLALRRAFPQELSGVYGDEEMQQAQDKDAPVIEAITTALVPIEPAPIQQVEMPDDTEAEDVDYTDRVPVNQWFEKEQRWDQVRTAPRASKSQVIKIGILRNELGHHLDRVITDPNTKQKSTQKEGKLRQNYFANFGKESTTELTSGEASRTIDWLEAMKSKFDARLDRDVPESIERMRIKKLELGGTQEKSTDPSIQCEKGNCGICAACKAADAYIQEMQK